MIKAILYSQPVDDAIPTIIHDNGTELVGYPGTDVDGDPCLIVEITPDATIGHGVTICWEHPNYYIEPQHCKLVQETGGACWLLHDVWRLVPKVVEPEPPTEPIPIPGTTPEEVIQYIFNSTHPDLSDHDGCGEFTADCQKALSDTLSALYGHIAKEPGQNQYDGHAVDAIMLLMPFGGVDAGIYDIIKNSVSPEAEPAFNWVEPANPSLWYNPAFESVKLVARKK